MDIQTFDLIKQHGFLRGNLKRRLDTKNLVGLEYLLRVKRNGYDSAFLETFLMQFSEKEIAKDSRCAYLYAENILHDRFELGEPAIAKDAHYSYFYAHRILHDRFELGEPAILRGGALNIRAYSFYVLKQRWPEAEKEGSVLRRNMVEWLRYKQHWYYEMAGDTLA